MVFLRFLGAEATCSESDSESDILLEGAERVSWKLAFSFEDGAPWDADWFLDGLEAEVRSEAEGIYFAAGPVERDDASHAVLWTKREFEGDLKITYDYTRLDSETQCVNILYLHAQGTGNGLYSSDITQWNHLREVPAMRVYFRNMNALHISYAAHFMRDGEVGEYIHARRYPVPDGGGFSDTGIGTRQQVEPFLIPGTTYEITVLKLGRKLLFSAKEKEGDVVRSFVWDTSEFDNLAKGRIGLRHMWTRISRYGNFKVWERSE